MARPNNKAEFTQLIRRKLGEPIISIEVTEDQFDDVIDMAIEFYCQNVYEGSKTSTYVFDIATGTLEYDLASSIPNLFAVTDILSPYGFDNSMFPTQYGFTKDDVDFLFSLGKLEGNSLVDYSIAMQNISAVNKMIVPKTSWDFNYNTGLLRFGSQPSMTKAVASCTILLDYDGSGSGKYWSNNLLTEYTTALAKIQWGQNMKKFSSMSIPGGGEINAQGIFDEGMAEKERIETEVKENLFYSPEAFTPVLA